MGLDDNKVKIETTQESNNHSLLNKPMIYDDKIVQIKEKSDTYKKLIDLKKIYDEGIIDRTIFLEKRKIVFDEATPKKDLKNKRNNK